MSDPHEMVCTRLTHARVRPCGHMVELGFKDCSGTPVSLALPHEALGMLLMTLPRLIETALQQRTGDASLRHVYPLGSWKAEHASDGASLLLRLVTPDDFAVFFCVSYDDAQGLVGVLAAFNPALLPGAPIRH
jgi:hypothetical protein